MGLADDSSLRPHVTTLSDELTTPPEPATLQRSIVDSLSRELRVDFASGEVTTTEAAREQELESSFVVSG
jgi:hypothetical protein